MDTNFLMPISIIGSFGLSLYYFTKVLTDYMLKKRMIDKGFVTDDTQAVFKSYKDADGKYPSLKWGLLFLTGGIALILMDALNVAPDSPTPYGIFAVSLSLGFLAYYFIIKRELLK